MNELNPAGHRARLRQRFLADAAGLPDADLLELLLAYAIPRQDVAPQAQELLARFGDLSGVLAATAGQLAAVPGIGEHAAAFLKVVGEVVSRTGQVEGNDQAPEAAQPALFEVEARATEPQKVESPDPAEPSRHMFDNDEAANALAFIPQAARFADVEAFRRYLAGNLPYNSESTRRRRANYLIGRFFRQAGLDTPLAFYAAHCSSETDLKPALFYHTVVAEPMLRGLVEDLVWPSLPLGRAGREDLRAHVLRLLPGLSTASQAKVLQAVFNVYEVFGVGTRDGASLRLQVHPGTLESFLYLLTAEFPQPGIYTLDQLENGPLRRWLLWDRDWLRRQLYNLQDLGLVAKISEIDAVRQFTITLDQPSALRRYYQDPNRGARALRERDGEAAG